MNSEDIEMDLWQLYRTGDEKKIGRLFKALANGPLAEDVDGCLAYAWGYRGVIRMTLNKKQKNCPYCHSEKPIISIGNDDIVIYIANSLDSQPLTTVFDFYNEAVTDEGFMKAPFGSHRRQINCCPMCGRNLGGHN